MLVNLVEEFQGWEKRSSGKFAFFLVFLRKCRRWAFSLKKNEKLQIVLCKKFSHDIFDTVLASFHDFLYMLY